MVLRRLSFCLVILSNIFLYSADSHSPYSINLMRINKKMDERQKHVIAKQDDIERIQYEPHIRSWAEKNPDAEINFWVDSRVTSDEAIQSFKYWIASQDKTRDHIILRDIRSTLEEVKKDHQVEVFSDKMPVYFRADLLRVLVTMHVASEQKKGYVVYADLDVKPMNKEKLFDSQTVSKLDKYGMVVTHGGWLGFENSFHILNASDSVAMLALNRAIIEVNIARAQNALHGKFYNTSGRQPEGPIKPLTQVVYDSYPSLFKYLYHEKGLGKLQVCRIEDGVKHYEVYDYQKHGIKFFGLRQLNSNISFEPIDEEIKTGNTRKFIDSMYVPTKCIKVPPAAGCGYN